MIFRTKIKIKYQRLPPGKPGSFGRRSEYHLNLIYLYGKPVCRAMNDEIDGLFGEPYHQVDKDENGARWWFEK
jgi:hypothetical protein